MSELIVGIDLGTTNSEIAIVRQGRVEVLRITEDSYMLPSVVGLTPDDTLLVGETARNQFLLHPDRTIRSIKRRMGSEERVTLGKESYLPQEISAMILRTLKSLAEKHLGQSVSKAVITVPAFFSDAQRRATREAGEMAGLEVVRIINEPTAAALAYGEAVSQQEQEDQPRMSSHILVYDLGGGTFDVSVVHLEGDVVEVLSSHGNNHLGGDDFDAKIVEYLVGKVEEQGAQEVRSSVEAMARLQRAAELAKIALSDAPYVTISEEYLLEHKGQPIHLKLEFSRLEYEEMIAPFIDETMASIHTALENAHLTIRDIDRILLVGGSSRTPCITQWLVSQLDMDVHAEINPDLCVAMGAALQGSVISGDNSAIVLVDVTPYTFGTSVLKDGERPWLGNKYFPIIYKNTPIPVTKTELLYTVYDTQDTIQIKVLQGDSEIPSNNVLLGEFMVNGLRSVARENEILITFSLDLNGIMKVNACEKATNLQKSITISNATSAISDEEMHSAHERIVKMTDDTSSGDGSAASDDTGSQLVRLKSEAESFLAKADKILSELSTEDAEDLSALMNNVKNHIALNDALLLKSVVEDMADMIYYLQND